MGLAAMWDHSDQAAPFVAVEVDQADLDADTDEGCVEWEVDFDDLVDRFVVSLHRRHS